MHVIAVAIGWTGYRAIETQQTALLERVLPVSTASQQSVDQISRLVLLAPQIGRIEDLERLGRFRASLAALLNSLRNKLGSNGLVDPETETRVAAVETALAAGFAAQSTRLSLEGRLETARQLVLEELDQLRLSLELIASERPRNAADRPITRVQDEVVQVLLRDLSNWRGQLLTLPSLTDQVGLDESEGVLRRGVREGVRALSQARLLGNESALAQALLKLLEALSDANGPYALQRDALASVLAVRGAIDELNSAAAQLARRLSTIVDGQNTRAAQAGLTLNETLRRSEWALFAVSLFALLLSAVFARQLVFQGVVEPLRRLTDRTRRLARGELDPPMPAASYQELSDIRDALIVFQANLRRLEATDLELRQQNEALTFANAELDRFAYAASHDLRSPLRGIRTLAGFIREDFEGDLPVAVSGHMNRLEDRLRKMENLLEDLLSYSRAGADAEAFESLSLRVLLEETVALLGPPEWADIAFEGALDQVELPPSTIRQALRNLIDNAIKHTAEQSELRIRVRAQIVHPWLEIQVEDNGPGIPLAYRARVQQMFQTLKPNAEEPTSGMGLPMVLRLIERSGGELEIDSADPPPGAIIRVRLPLQGEPEAFGAQQVNEL